MDTIIQVDKTLCITCGACIRTCPGDLITKEEFPIPIPDACDQRIDCFYERARELARGDL